MPDLHETINQFLEGSIASIGRDPVIESKSITANGTYTAPEGVDGYSPITVNVPTPTPVIESKSITANGTYTAPEGVDGYSPITVNVPTPTPVIESKSITANGTYTAPEGVDGYSPITVNVPTPTPVIESKSITANGTYTAPEGVDGYSPITVNVPLPTNAYILKSVTTPTPIASFSDGEEMVMPTLKVAIEPQQEGSGDPSPTNVRPISGWSAVNVYDYKAYQICEATYSSYTNNGITIAYKGKGNYEVSGRMTTNEMTELSVNFTGFTIYDGTDSYIAFNNSYSYSNLYVQLKNDNTNVERWDFSANNRTSAYTAMRGKSINKFTLNVPNTLYGNDISFTFRVEFYSNDSKTTYTIPFTDGQGQSVTVYGGSVDVVNGIVTPAPYYASYNGEALTGEWISDRDKYEVGTTPTIGAQVVNIGASGTPVSILPTAVKSLRGVNNVWADTGDITDAEYFSKEV